MLTGFMAALIAVGCQSSPLEPQAEVASVEVSPAELSTRAGTLARFQAVARDAAGKEVAGAFVDWTTSDPSIAIIDSDGYVWTFQEGTATATASAPGRGKGAANGNAYGHAKKDAQVQVTQIEPDRPGRVTDLNVTGATTNSISLSFTEVDDGTGGSAEYLVRFETAPLDWGTAENVVQGTCAAPLQGSAPGSEISCSVQGLDEDTKYEFRVIAIRSGDNVYGDLSNLTSGTTEAAESTPSTPSSGSTIEDNTWTTITPPKWYSAGNREIVSVLDSDDVLQMTYPEGFEGGVGPANLSYNWQTNDGLLLDSIRVSMRWTANSGWQSHKSNVNKIAFIFLKERGNFVVVMYKDHIRIAPEKPGGWNWLYPNVNFEASKPRLGAWNDMEFEFAKTAPSTWSVKWWVNGTLVGEHTGVSMDAGYGDQSLRSISLNPTWGGTGDTKNQTDYYWWDRVTVSAGG